LDCLGGCLFLALSSFLLDIRAPMCVRRIEVVGVVVLEFGFKLCHQGVCVGLCGELFEHGRWTNAEVHFPAIVCCDKVPTSEGPM
jgi:hypothetical protein